LAAASCSVIGSINVPAYPNQAGNTAFFVVLMKTLWRGQAPDPFWPTPAVTVTKGFNRSS
jgi:hypothetical protein